MAGVKRMEGKEKRLRRLRGLVAVDRWIFEALATAKIMPKIIWKGKHCQMQLQVAKI